MVDLLLLFKNMLAPSITQELIHVLSRVLSGIHENVPLIL
jgi:hypothetical protein